MADRYTHRQPSPQKNPCQGPLSGRRVVIQPNMSVRDWPCDAGTRALAGYIALQDASAVSRLIASGAALTGSARMAELGFGLAGDTAALLMADGEADLALITDTMGEARLAAARAGFFGFKPSYGIISRFGLIGLVPSMECFGIVAPDPSTIMDALGAMAGPDPHDPSMPDHSASGICADETARQTPVVAGIIKESLDLLDGKARDLFQSQLAHLSDAGLALKEVSLEAYDLFRDVHQVVASVEASSSAGKYDGVRYGHRCPAARNWNDMYLNTRGEAFGPLVKCFLFQGAYFQFEDYPAFETACRIRGRLVRAAEDLLGRVDLLVSPTRRQGHDPFAATTIEDTYQAFLLTLPAGVTGLPALHTPVPAAAGEFAPGIQLVGRRWDDARLLSFGQRLLPAAQEEK